MKTIFTFLLIQSFIYTIEAQNFLNGSFENNTANICLFNIGNASFNANMMDVRGIGDMQTLDIFYFTACPLYGTAQHGDFCSSLENTFDSTTSTALSLKLADTLLSGQAYTFCYYDKGQAGAGAGPVEIGLSSNDSTFGTLVYTSPLIDSVWTQRTVSFTAPLNGSYITARYKVSNVYNGMFIDNFGMCTPTSTSNLSTEKENYKLYPNPASTELNILLLKNEHLKSVSIMNQLGQIKYSSKDESIINMSGLANGLYYIQIETDKTTYNTMFMKY